VGSVSKPGLLAIGIRKAGIGGCVPAETPARRYRAAGFEYLEKQPLTALDLAPRLPLGAGKHPGAISELPCLSLRVRPNGLLGPDFMGSAYAWHAGRVSVDYPGEWLLDLGR